ncbi:hypothetical protein ACMD2_21060 [Ananas comosus]|uniref:Protein kinase domain-containing protein n=1 Tax=Ananas comosus TaxID=4615 RepID=A0A199VX80_ANACO|nr:hypothetical protein ACMD2_21060 [Ananas comosus]
MNPKILDFGLARITGQNENHAHTKKVVENILTGAKERMRSQKVVDVPTYRCRSGRKTYEEVDDDDVVKSDADGKWGHGKVDGDDVVRSDADGKWAHGKVDGDDVVRYDTDGKWTTTRSRRWKVTRSEMARCRQCGRE